MSVVLKVLNHFQEHSKSIQAFILPIILKTYGPSQHMGKLHKGSIYKWALVFLYPEGFTVTFENTFLNLDYMKRKLVLKKRSISNLNIFRLVGGTGTSNGNGNSLDDETNQQPTYNCAPPPTQNQHTCVYTNCYDGCSVNPTQCMVEPPTHP